MEVALEPQHEYFQQRFDREDQRESGVRLLKEESARGGLVVHVQG